MAIRPEDRMRCLTAPETASIASDFTAHDQLMPERSDASVADCLAAPRS